MSEKKQRIITVACWLVALGLFGIFVVIPMIQRETMRIPITDGLLALNRGDVAKLQGCFTGDAVVRSGDFQLPVTQVLNIASPYLKQRPVQETMHFLGYRNILRHSSRLVEADFRVVAFIEGGDYVPYRQVPMQKSGHVLMDRVGLFTWKIKEISSPDLDAEILKHLVGSFF